MKSLYKKHQPILLCAVACLALLTTSCLPEDEDLELGPRAEAAFAITDISTPEMRNTYRLESTTENAFVYQWDTGDGNAPFVGNRIDTVQIENKGQYTIKLTTLSEGGHSTASQEVAVEEDAVTGTSAVAGGDMVDETAWNFMSTGGTITSYAFSNEALTFTNDNASGTGIQVWQAVELKGGRAYEFDAAISGSGMTNSWVEILLLDEEPVEGIDPADNRFAGLNTWTGCGVDPFDGAFSSYSCLGDGRINIAEDGTYYLIIKVGSSGGYLGADGFTIDNIEFIAQPRLMEGENILQGSSMEDESVWTVSSMSMPLTTVEFTGEVMKFSNGSTSTQTNIGVWQAVDVAANQIYKLDATVNNPASTGSWVEFYLSTTEPADGVDYTTGRIEPGNTKSFDAAGTVYVLIKVGSWDGTLGPDGVTIDDVELVEMN